MNKNVGRECPYCKKIIQVDENIVVCSNCGIAHHLECWNENRGCTTYDCDGKPISPEGRKSEGLTIFKDKSNSIYPKASIGLRLVAYLLDGLIGGAVALIGLISMGVTVGIHGPRFNEGAAIAGMGFIFVIGIIWGVFYAFTKDGWGQGQSLGKRAVGLMVIDLSSNQPCTKGKSALRNLINMALNFIPYIGWLVEPIMVLANEKGRRLGDLAANTQVIRRDEFLL